MLRRLMLFSPMMEFAVKTFGLPHI